MFSPQQKQIIELFGQGQAVVAGAGCGKTTTLVAKCLTLIRSQPKARFCAVSFTEKSVRDLKASLAKGFTQEGVLYDSKTHWVKTLHGLCSTILQEFPMQAGLQGGERIILEDESARLWERSVNLLWSQNDNAEISEAIALLLKTYSKNKLEALLQKLRSLMSFGVDELIHKSFSRDDVRSLWVVFQSVYHRYQHYKTREGALDFNDLEIKALRALDDPKVGLYYQKRFDLILVDEFQDTNPIQGKILERFVRPGFTNLCIVGDPKQSIYRFRDADVSVFLDLTAKLPHRHLLDTNYRSRPEIIDFVNRVCEPAFLASELNYEPLVSGRDSEADRPRPNVTRLSLDDEFTIARFLKSEEARGIDLSDYVILARSLRKDKTQKVIHSLDALQVPFMLGSGGRFYADPRVQELVAFLKGWLSPKNTLSQVAALRSPWIGIKDKTLLEWKDVYFEQFFKESEHPIAIALRDDFLKASPLRPGQILERLWQLDILDDEMGLALVTLWHKSEQLSSQGRRFEEVVQYFCRAIEEDRLEKEIPPPAQKGMVRLMTVHASKGLQFPRVILIDFEGVYRSAGSSADLIWDRKKGVHLFHRDEAGKKIADDAENTSWSEVEKKALVAESKRLFYVAITRPQEELILAWKPEAKVIEEPYLHDTWRGWVEASGDIPVSVWSLSLSLSSVQTSENGTELKLKPALQTQTPLPQFPFKLQSFRPRHSPSEWMVLNECALRYQRRFLELSILEAGTKEEKQRDREFLEEDSPRESIAKKGERVHSLLEFSDWTALAKEFRNEKIAAPILEQLQLLLGESSPAIHVYKELGFEIPLSEREALVGIMDRLEIYPGERRIRVVDYKWTQRPKKKEVLLAHYLLQLQLYAWAASRMADFVPEKIEACLVHLTQDSLEGVEASQEHFNLEEISLKISAFFEKSKKTLQTYLDGGSNLPTVGEFCAYCEFKNSCPAFAKPH